MKVKAKDTERSVYPETHRTDENVKKVWNLVCVDKAKSQTHYVERLKSISQICALLPTKHSLLRCLWTGTPDLAPSNFKLFLQLKSTLKGLRCQDTTDVQKNIM